ncbi:hypothetical protein CcCBS67573_g00067 [Chytriomyces confervae]|uniref:N-acetylglucosaminylphosphatidylinositol deacetylase n=1 Tax=Chytriomyces confervae TaxID=246404 RepID=A0A507FQI1_9FUNG|nr:hypothetical protein CcCBS67573_g00067 [Chytriomyces confervae]
MWIVTQFLIAAVGVSLALYLYVCANPSSRANLFLGSLAQTGTRVLLLVAHPDDECMFFGPTALQLSANADVHAVSVSNGNFDGLGSVREKEFVESCKVLGLRPGRVSVWDHESMPDGMNVWWKEDDIASAVGKYVLENQIEIIITFDKYGISGHPNHRAVFAGVRRLLQQPVFMKKVKAYSLVSAPLLRKFISLLDLFPTLVMHFRHSLRFKARLYETRTAEEVKLLHTNRVDKERILFLSTPSEMWKARRAMICHASQLVWFRHLYLVFSRYMVMNELEEI